MDVVLQHAQPGATDSGFAYYWLWQQPNESPFVGKFTERRHVREPAARLLQQLHPAVRRRRLLLLGGEVRDRRPAVRPDVGLPPRRPADPGHPRGDPGHPRPARGVGGSFAYIIEDTWDYSAVDATNKVNATNCWYDVMRSHPANYISYDHHVDTQFLRVLNAGKDFNAGKGPVTYLENHDHSTITLSAGGRGLWYRLQPYIIALYTTPGAVMVANGQEFGRVEFLWENDGDKPANEKRVQPRPLRWAEADDGPGQALRDKYARLAKIRADHPGLRSSNFYPDFYDEAWAHFGPGGYGVDVDKQVVIYHRWGPAEDHRTERFIVLLNFSGYDQWVDLPFPTNGDWDDLLNGFRVHVSDYWIRNFRVSSYWGHVFYQKE